MGCFAGFLYVSPHFEMDELCDLVEYKNEITY